MESNIHAILLDVVVNVSYSGKLLREKTFVKVFSLKLGGVESLDNDTSKQSTKGFSAKILFPPNHSLESFPLYGIPSKQLLLGGGNYTVGQSTYGMWLHNI